MPLLQFADQHDALISACGRRTSLVFVHKIFLRDNVFNMGLLRSEDGIVMIDRHVLAGCGGVLCHGPVALCHASRLQYSVGLRGAQFLRPGHVQRCCSGDPAYATIRIPPAWLSRGLRITL